MTKIRFLVGDKVSLIQVETQSSLLEQALSQNLSISYSCRRGDCGQCLGELLDGKVEPLDVNKPLLQKEKLYLCNALARSDLTVRLPYSPETEHIKVLRSPCKIHELRPLSENVMEVRLRMPQASQFEFVPGQYIHLTNKERVTRSYSLAAPPASDRHLCIHVKRIDGGLFSDYLFLRARQEDVLHLEGPLGRFVMPDRGSVSKTIFLATGTGIAPAHAILSALTVQQLSRCGALFLYWGNRCRKDAYWHDRLGDLAQRLGVRYVPVFSREASSGSAVQLSYVQDLVAAEHADLKDARIYASGNPAMVETTCKQAAALGLPAGNFHADPFTAS
ncbi:MAG: FAD-binding oxidoreductase [Kiritimatiellae bacterium]|nr:FAD-binding oxidoreductase [Kiritimatiellia bacterium]